MISSTKKCESPLKKLRKLFRTNSKGSYELERDSYFNYNDEEEPKLYPADNAVRFQFSFQHKFFFSKIEKVDEGSLQSASF